MPIVFFSDIDDTLIQSKRKCIDEPQLITNAVNINGVSSSFSTPRQQSLIDMCQQHIFIPVTGRHKAALDRVAIESLSYQVVDHGAIVVNEQGVLDTQWQQLLDNEALKWQTILEEYVEKVQVLMNEQNLVIRCRVIYDFDYACYVSIKGDASDLVKLSSITDQFSELADNTRVHFNGNNMALLPPYACKKRAVEFLQQRFIEQDSHSLFIGMGDSNSDLDFMKTCHFQMMPQKSQITAEKLT